MVLEGKAEKIAEESMAELIVGVDEESWVNYAGRSFFDRGARHWVVKSVSDGMMGASFCAEEVLTVNCGGYVGQ